MYSTHSITSRLHSFLISRWSWRRSAVALLSRVLSALWRWRAAIASLLWRGLTVLGRSAILARWWSTVAAWWAAAVLAWRWSSLRWHSVTSWAAWWWWTAHAWLHMRLLVLGVVAGVDGAENELDHPEVGCQIDGRVSPCHFGRFVLIIYISSQHKFQAVWHLPAHRKVISTA